jgi:hypothetical protein
MHSGYAWALPSKIGSERIADAFAVSADLESLDLASDDPIERSSRSSRQKSECKLKR